MTIFCLKCYQTYLWTFQTTKMSTRTDTTDFDFENANFCVLVRQKTYQKIRLRTECIWPWAYYIDATYIQKGFFRGLTSPEEVQEMLRVVKMAKFCSGDHALRLEYHIVIWLFLKFFGSFCLFLAPNLETLKKYFFFKYVTFFASNIC